MASRQRRIARRVRPADGAGLARHASGFRRPHPCPLSPKPCSLHCSACCACWVAVTPQPERLQAREAVICPAQERRDGSCCASARSQRLLPMPGAVVAAPLRHARAPRRDAAPFPGAAALSHATPETGAGAGKNQNRDWARAPRARRRPAPSCGECWPAPGPRCPASSSQAPLLH